MASSALLAATTRSAAGNAGGQPTAVRCQIATRLRNLPPMPLMIRRRIDPATQKPSRGSEMICAPWAFARLKWASTSST